MSARGLVIATIAVSACSATPTTLTVTVDILPGQSVVADHIRLVLPSLSGGPNELVYDPDSTDDAGNPTVRFPATLVVILPDSSGGETLIVDVGAQDFSVDPDGGAPVYTTVAEGATVVDVVAHRPNEVEVSLTPGSSCVFRSSTAPPVCDAGGEDALDAGD